MKLRDRSKVCVDLFCHESPRIGIIACLLLYESSPILSHKFVLAIGAGASSSEGSMLSFSFDVQVRAWSNEGNKIALCHLLATVR